MRHSDLSERSAKGQNKELINSVYTRPVYKRRTKIKDDVGYNGCHIIR